MAVVDRHRTKNEMARSPLMKFLAGYMSGIYILFGSDLESTHWCVSSV